MKLFNVKFGCLYTRLGTCLNKFFVLGSPALQKTPTKVQGTTDTTHSSGLNNVPVHIIVSNTINR